VIVPFGERALLVDLPEAGTSPLVLLRSLDARPVAGIIELVPGRSSLLVELDENADEDAVTDELLRRVDGPETAPEDGGGRVRSIPVVYGGEHGPDLGEVARLAGLHEDDVIARHLATELRVLFCGFAPGFAYLGELPADLRVDRLATPRTGTPAGSVAIAGPMSGIYPADLPGGWRVIGRTPVRLFDPAQRPPAYLVPGDTVRWERIRPEDWAARTETADW
jgi:KipI family sensor histidine kinase inhibitor